MDHPTVLVVEDRPGVLRLMATILEGRYRVATAADGPEALARLAAEPFDVVLTDVRLPGASGFEVLRAARERAPRTSVVMMTAYANVPDAVAAMRQGAFDYVAKPLDADEVALAVARAALRAREPPRDAEPGADLAGLPDAASMGFHRAIDEVRFRASRAYLVEILRGSGGNVTRAAHRAGMTRESFHRVMRKYGVSRIPGPSCAPGPEEPEAGADPHPP